MSRRVGGPDSPPLSKSTLALLGKVGIQRTTSDKDGGGQKTNLYEQWRNQRTVVVFFRRFQCPYCKMMASDVSKIRADLCERNVRLVGVGSGSNGLEEFKVKRTSFR